MLNNYIHNIDIFSALNSLNIKHQNKPNGKGWIPVVCPFHHDKNYGNASININSGVISCYKCGVSRNISSLLKERQINYQFTPTIVEEQEVKKSNNISDSLKYYFIHKEIDPNDFYYLKQRGFTKEFCDTFKVVRCFTDPNSDYFAYPIVDSNKGITNVEFRKLMQAEYLQSYYGSQSISYGELSESFKQYCLDNDLHITDYKLYKGKEIIVDKVLLYLLDKKVKYEQGSRIKETIWNIDNLNYNETLFLVEGFGSLGRIWSYLSKNVTCTFGSQVSDAQIEYLQKFNKVVIIPDADEAGVKMVLKLRDNIVNLLVIDTKFEDTDKEYISSLSDTNNCKSVEEYLSKSIIKYNKTLF